MGGGGGGDTAAKLVELTSRKGKRSGSFCDNFLVIIVGRETRSGGSKIVTKETG